MELHYRITPDHLQSLIAEALKQELLKQDAQQARALATFARWQSRLIGPLMFALCLIGALLAVYLPERRITPEKAIALLLFTLVFIPLWWRFSGRWLGHLQARIAANHAKPRAPVRGLNQRLIEARLRVPLKSAQDTYKLSFDDQGFTLDKARGGKTVLAWEQVVHLLETPDFYHVASADMRAKGMACLIARHSELMPADDYQQGLQAFLSHCPVTASAPATSCPSTPK